MEFSNKSSEFQLYSSCIFQLPHRWAPLAAGPTPRRCGSSRSTCEELKPQQSQWHDDSNILDTLVMMMMMMMMMMTVFMRWYSMITCLDTSISLLVRGSLIWKLRGCGRWSWLVVSPSWPPHHCGHTIISINHVDREHVSSGLKTLAGSKPCAFWG